MGKVITIVGTQGAGKSSTVINIAWALEDILRDCFDGRAGGCPVLLMDATPESTTTSFCTTKTRAKVEKLAHGDHEAKYVYTTRNPRARSKHVSKLQRAYDTVIVDTSSADLRQVDELMKATDSIILVTSPYEEETTWLRFLKSAKEGNPDATLNQILFNKYDPNRRIDTTLKDSAEDILKMDRHVISDYMTVFPHAEELAVCYDQKVPAYIADPRLSLHSVGAKDLYADLTRHLFGAKKPLYVDLLISSIERKLAERAELERSAA